MLQKLPERCGNGAKPQYSPVEPIGKVWAKKKIPIFDFLTPHFWDFSEISDFSNLVGLPRGATRPAGVKKWQKWLASHFFRKIAENRPKKVARQKMCPKI